jgi:aconitate hydratase
VNLEYLARVIMAVDSSDSPLCFPDTLVGTDSHTTMVNGLGRDGVGRWRDRGGSGNARPADLDADPQVLGFRLSGIDAEGARHRPGADDYREAAQARRRRQVRRVLRPGLEHLTIADRATLGNMCPEYGATIAIFPIDEMTLDYLR